MSTTARTTDTTVWACINFADAPAGIAFCTDVLGFTQTARYTHDADESVVVHAELVWPEGGGIMCGSAGRADSPFSQMPTGVASTYVVTADPRAVWDRCQDAGATVVKPMEDEDYGSRGFSVADPEGNIWSFGTYAGTERGDLRDAQA